MNFLNERVQNDRYFGYFQDGDTVCNAAGILIHQISIPSSILFTEVFQLEHAIIQLNLWRRVQDRAMLFLFTMYNSCCIITNIPNFFF
jgi:hypothetical protein